MAYLFKQKKSAFWWVEWRDPSTGKKIRQSTKLTDIFRARKLCAELRYKESQIPTPNDKEHWDHWVERFFEERYGQRKLRAQIAWRTLRLFWDELQITSSRQVTRDHATDYLLWRSKPNKSIGKYHAGRNTSILEIKFMSIILDEAVRKGFATHNPWLKLNLHREHQKVKPEYTRPALAKILWNIRHEPEPKRQFFLMSFLISRYHGCRLSETHFNPQTQIDLSVPNPTISFLAKGSRVHTVNLHPKLLRRFRRMIEAGRTETYTPPKSPAKEWFNYLTRIGIKKEFPGACFHSLRVTAATTLARKGVDEKKAMRYIGHASTTIHRSYVRLKPDDLVDCSNAIS
jgi:hypothetical protein